MISLYYNHNTIRDLGFRVLRVKGLGVISLYYKGTMISGCYKVTIRVLKEAAVR